MIFKGDYSFKGSYAEKVISLTAAFSQSHRLFNRNLDVYILAPIVGFIYGQTADEDSGGKPTNILYDAMSKELPTLWFNYRLIMLLDKKYEPNFDLRVDKAFRNYGKEIAKSDEERYESYVRDGVNILYDKLIATVKTEDDYLKNLYEFIEEFDERYGQSRDEITDLCRLARS
jgi:phosphoglycolate phosphatase-like HAD superfamily hydrolase